MEHKLHQHKIHSHHTTDILGHSHEYDLEAVANTETLLLPRADIVSMSSQLSNIVLYLYN